MAAYFCRRLCLLMSSKKPLSYGLWLASGIAFLASLSLVFFWAPTDITEGAVQRIIYTHVPIAILGLIAIVMVAFFSIMYLVQRRRHWDRLAVSTAEVGVILGVLILVQGMIWSRPTWGVWWNTDPKLITSLVLTLIYGAYLVFRAYFPPGAARARLSAVIALIGAINAPIVYYATELFDPLTHPGKIIGPMATEQDSLGAAFLPPFLVSFLAMTLMFVLLVVTRYRLARSEDRLLRAKAP